MVRVVVSRPNALLPVSILHEGVPPCCRLFAFPAATVSVINGWGHRLGTVYLGQMPESGQLILTGDLTHLLEDTLKRWDGPLPRLHYVTDCGHHPTEYFETVLSKMMNPRRPEQPLNWEWVVDYYHACLYITKLAEAIFGPGRDAFVWAAKQRRVLKTKPGGVFRVLRSAGALLSIRGLMGSEQAYNGAYNFLRERAGKMDYVTCRRRKLPIGSGITEAACKVLFTQRFKQSGMKWKIAGGAPILMLRTISLSRIWRDVRSGDLFKVRRYNPRRWHPAEGRAHDRHHADSERHRARRPHGRRATLAAGL